MRLLYTFFLFFITIASVAQTEEQDAVTETDSITTFSDPKYREDQFYTSISYVLMQNKPGNYSQNSFSTGISFGFLRDMPVNEARTYAIAVGLGYAYSNIKHNLKITETAGTVLYEEPDNDEFDKNKLVLHCLELPIEFRWRNSNSSSHKFWRVYTGFKASYLFADKAQFYQLSGGSTKVKSNDDMNRLLYGVYVSAGWNTWNFYAYYGLNPLFNKDARLDNGQQVNLNAVNFGLMFYIL
ncbi:porin family protein [Flavobacterium sp.]|uniref:porin family protein n=1 Tax=Flavobacterium sp. TaxID=239 RepID=UPI00261F9E58|nr:porin family protein [Flavobacterium sp.]